MDKERPAAPGLQHKAVAENLRRWLPETLQASPLLAQALTHRSAEGPHNERLEFLGDAILGMVIAEALFQRLPVATEGELTRLRAALVNGHSLAERARAVGIDAALILGDGERKAGGHRRDSILADALEALIGACYQEGGFAATRTFILTLFAERLDQLPPADHLKDPKTRLQEWLQRRGRELPQYQVVEVSGPEHDRHFRVQVRLPPADWAETGNGPSRRRAEQAAAQSVLERLTHPESRKT